MTRTPAVIRKEITQTEIEVLTAKTAELQAKHKIVELKDELAAIKKEQNK